MATIGTLIVNLGIDATDLRKGERQVQSSFGRMEKLAAKTAASIGGIFAGIQIANLAKDIVKTADTMRLLEGRLKLVTGSQEEFTDAQKRLFDISNDTRNAFEGTLTLYARMARAAQTTGASQNDMLQVTESINKALTVSGATTAESTGALIQLSQGLAANAFRGQEMNSVLEQTPRVAQLIADGLGVSIGKLREMGSEGELTAKRVIDAILSQREAIDREFAQMPQTVGQALTVANNHWQKFVGEFDKASGMTDALVDGIENITSSIKGLDSTDIEKIASAMSLIASAAAGSIKVVAAYYALFIGPGVIAGIGAWIKGMYNSAAATVQLNNAVASGNAVMLNSAQATAMKAAAEATAAKETLAAAEANAAAAKADLESLQAKYSIISADMQLGEVSVATATAIQESTAATAAQASVNAEAAAMALNNAKAQAANTEASLASAQAKFDQINIEKNQITTLLQEANVLNDNAILEQRFAVASREAAVAQAELRAATVANASAQQALATATGESIAATKAKAIADEQALGAAATTKFAAAQAELQAATNKSASAQASLATASAANTAAMNKASDAAKKSRGSFLNLNSAVNIAFAGFVGWEVGKLLVDNFEIARIAGVYFVDWTIRGFYELERVAKIVIAGISNGWSGVFDLLLLKQAKTNELMAKGLDFISKDAADRLREIAGKMRDEIGKNFKDEKVKINIEFDEKMADRAKIIAQMLAESTDEYSRKQKDAAFAERERAKILQELAAAEKKYREEQDALLDRLLPLQSLQKQYKMDLQTLGDWYKRNSDKSVEYQKALENLNNTYQEARQSIVSSEIQKITEALNKEYEERIKKEQQLQEVMFNRLELEKGAIELKKAADQITEPEAAAQTLEVLQQELAIRQQLHDQVIGTSAEATLARQEQLMQIQQINAAIIEQKNLLQDKTWVDGMKEAWNEYSKSVLNSFEQAKGFATRSLQTIEDSLVELATTGKTSVEDMAKSILADLLRIQIRALLVRSIMAFTGGGGGGGGFFHDGMEPSYRPPKFHSGMSPAYQPPKLHNGLKPDEFPAILQTGERVTSRKDVNAQNKQLADYERWKMGGSAQEGGGGVNISVPIALDPSFSKRFRSELQGGIESTVMDVVKRFS